MYFSTVLGISVYLRKIALRLKLRKVIEQQGDQYIVKTLSTFKNYTISFKIDQAFEEFTKGLDNRHIKVRTDVVDVPLAGVCKQNLLADPILCSDSDEPLFFFCSVCNLCSQR